MNNSQKNLNQMSSLCDLNPLFSMDHLLTTSSAQIKQSTLLLLLLSQSITFDQPYQSFNSNVRVLGHLEIKKFTILEDFAYFFS